jgi:hypothetical protein
MDLPEGAATGNLRDLRVLCGEIATPSICGRFRAGRARAFFTTEDTEVTEALGILASHMAGLRI